LDDPEVVVLDVRTPAEFAGDDVRAARGGHIPGAVNMDWTLAIDRGRNLRLKPEGDLRRMLEELGVTPDKEVIVHCQTHHRSAHTYMVLKSLGYPRIRGYDGSWSEWGNDQNTPIES
jgi:thiosulfate/3-mercaptopyruvate sulfurtransferase